jgi:hypothetical protein
VTFALVPLHRLDLDVFARAAGLHPDLVRRLVALGLLEAASDGAGELWFLPGDLRKACRLQRLRAGLSLNYASLGVVVDLLDRIADLEAALRNRPQLNGGRPWTQTD